MVGSLSLHIFCTFILKSNVNSFICENLTTIFIPAHKRIINKVDWNSPFQSTLFLVNTFPVSYFLKLLINRQFIKFNLPSIDILLRIFFSKFIIFIKYIQALFLHIIKTFKFRMIINSCKPFVQQSTRMNISQYTIYRN